MTSSLALEKYSQLPVMNGITLQWNNEPDSRGGRRSAALVDVFRSETALKLLFLEFSRILFRRIPVSTWRR